MKCATRVVIVAAGLLLGMSVQAQAQMLQWSDRFFVNVNGAVQNQSVTDVSTSSEFALYGETARTSTKQTIEGKGGIFEISGGARVYKNFGIGVGYSAIETSGTGSVDASYPHPLIYDLPRTASAELPDLIHKEQAVHVMALFVLPITGRFDIAVSAGPTFFTLEQATIGAPKIEEVGPPYTRINLTGVTKVTTTMNKTGFNVGADVTFKIVKFVGVGGFVRYAAAKMEYTPEGGQAISVNVGGLQAGGGLRIRF